MVLTPCCSICGPSKPSSLHISNLVWFNYLSQAKKIEYFFAPPDSGDINLPGTKTEQNTGMFTTKTIWYFFPRFVSPIRKKVVQLLELTMDHDTMIHIFLGPNADNLFRWFHHSTPNNWRFLRCTKNTCCDPVHIWRGLHGIKHVSSNVIIYIIIYKISHMTLNTTQWSDHKCKVASERTSNCWVSRTIGSGLTWAGGLRSNRKGVMHLGPLHLRTNKRAGT